MPEAAVSKLLVAYSTRYGSTRVIAEAVASVLEQKGAQVDVLSVEEVESLAGYDAAVIGAPVHVGRWVREARDFAAGFAGELRAMPVAVFAAGIALARDPDKSDELATAWMKGVRNLLQPVAAAAFAGELDTSKLSVVWKILLAVIRAPRGDYRDWDKIRTWADSIAAPLGIEGASGESSGQRL